MVLMLVVVVVVVVMMMMMMMNAACSSEIDRHLVHYIMPYLRRLLFNPLLTSQFHLEKFLQNSKRGGHKMSSWTSTRLCVSVAGVCDFEESAFVCLAVFIGYWKETYTFACTVRHKYLPLLTRPTEGHL